MKGTELKTNRQSMEILTKLTAKREVIIENAKNGIKMGMRGDLTKREYRMYKGGQPSEWKNQPERDFETIANNIVGREEFTVI
jgi:hypothetical protein